MEPLELVVFDMAGTTVVDGGEVPAAFMAALATAGIHVTAAQINAVRGAAKRQAVLELTPEGRDRETRAAATYEMFKLDLAAQFKSGVKPVPGAREAFDWLRGKRVKVALNTGFDRDITELLLAALGWNDKVVDAVACGDDVLAGRPAPYLIFRCMERTGAKSVHRVAVVGDTILDLQAGDNAGVRWNIGVLSGAHRQEQLEQQPHTHLIASVAELKGVFSDV